MFWYFGFKGQVTAIIIMWGHASLWLHHPSVFFLPVLISPATGGPLGALAKIFTFFDHFFSFSEEESEFQFNKHTKDAQRGRVCCETPISRWGGRQAYRTLTSVTSNVHHAGMDFYFIHQGTNVWDVSSLAKQQVTHINACNCLSKLYI